jgi:Cu/Ag efflux protein CusF
VKWLWAAALLLSACAARRPIETEPVSRYALEGRVVRVDAERRVAMIQHGPLADAQGEVWMPPMTMEFAVKDPIDVVKLRKGETIRATVFRPASGYGYWLGEVKAP